MSKRQLWQRGANISEHERRVHLADGPLLLNGSLKIARVHGIQSDVVSLDCIAGIDLYRSPAFFQGARHITAVKICERKIRDAGVICGIPADQLLELFLSFFGLSSHKIVGRPSPVLLWIPHPVDFRQGKPEGLSRWPPLR